VAAMKRRQFTDRNGVTWDVYAIVVAPGTPIMKPALSHQLQRTKTYLAFDSEYERRRLSPFPLGWDEATQEELERLLGLSIKISMTVRRKE
jgi:hypothetical protein